MFGAKSGGASAYAKVGIETGVIAASPHRLIVMLFDGAIVAVSSAKQHMQSGSIAAKGQSISKAITIIDSGLRASLDRDTGGEIAQGLDSLYEYMSGRLLEANATNNVDILDEVQRLLEDLRGAWNAIGPAVVEQPPQPAALPSTPALDALTPHTSRLMKA